MHNAWGAKASTPNALLTIKESERSGPVIKFRLYATGVPKDTAYGIVAWPVTQKGPGEVLTGVTLDASGLAICAGVPGTCGTSDKPNDPIDLGLQPAPGEPVRLGLVSADGAVKVFAKLVPVPLRGENRGCTVEGVVLTPGAEVILIEGSGFPADSDLKVDSNSGSESHSEKGKTDIDGRYSVTMLPYNQGVRRGTLEVTLKSAGCSPSTRVPWGRRN